MRGSLKSTACSDEDCWLRIFYGGKSLGGPYAALRVLVFPVYTSSVVNQTSFDLFEAVRFLTDELEFAYPDASSLQEPARVLATFVAEGICAFRFRMKFVLLDNFAVRFDARGIPIAGRPSSGDAIFFAAVFIDPSGLKPVP